MRCHRTGFVFTMLREPSRRALSQRGHFLSDKHAVHHGSTRVGAALWNASDREGVFGAGCEHNASFCAALQDRSKCRLRGSCGVFQNFQAIFLAGTYERTLDS